MTTFASIFTGFDGVGIGARAAGCDLAWGIENDPKIAEVARANGHLVTVVDVLNCNPADFERVDIMHASPPCTRASVANHAAEMDERGLREAALDRALATKTAEFIAVLRPRIVTIENVWGYRRFDSWRIIEEALYQAGYWLTVSHLDAADYGVPQNRKRMIVRAIWLGDKQGGYLPPLPPKEKWVGWYQAIKDLIPTLPESKFAPWQLARLNPNGNTLVDSAGYVDADGRLPVTRGYAQPANTIVSNHGIRPMRAFIMQTQGQGGDGLRLEDEPMQSITAVHTAGKYRAFIVDCQYNNRGPERGLNIRQADEPMLTVAASASHRVARAWLSAGRVVAMTPRALARFQSFPDSYQLPDTNRLAVKGIGNAVPPLMYEKIIRQLI